MPSSFRWFALICAVVLCGFTLLPVAQAETGLVATYSAGKTTVRRVVPTPSFTLAVDESVHPQISPEFEAVYEGALKIVRGGEYRFSGDARIEVDGQDVAGKALKLTTGERAIKITYLRKPGPARLQVRWQSDFFIDEPIPASAYAYAKKQEDDLTKLWASIEHGRLLYENLNCGSCHGADEWNLSSRQGPDLSAVGSRVSGDWLQAWLKDPKHYRKSTSMPALLTSDGEVRDVTAFLLSLAKALADEADTPNAGRIEAGKELFNEVGCAKCHGEANHSLTEVGGKYRSSQALARYLLDPLQVDPNGRMPQFFDSKTQAHEAALVAEYLFHGKSRDWPKFSGGDAFRGRKIVQARGCAACHSVKFDDQILPNRLVAPQFTKKNAPPDAQKGCLAETPPAGAPNYRLEVADRVGLQDFLQSLVTAAVVAKAPVETFHRRLSQFNCAACHSATAQANPADAAFFALERPPSLDGAGAKLQVNWIRRVLLEGKRTRPWMKMRMPHFGGAVESLPALFPLSSGSQPVDEVPIPDKKVAAVGLQAVAICVSCHDYRDVNRQQEGVVPAPNLAEVGETLKRFGLRAERRPDIARDTAERVAGGQVVCWFQGRLELGPRALGARSIISDPRSGEMKARVNTMKGRQWWRPFGPSILAGAEADWFLTPFDTRFMLFTVPVREDKQGQIPAVLHVDGTTRPQSVTEADNPAYHAVISAFHRLTGVPMVLNTSFNTAFEPIVQSPEDAISSFLQLGVDALAIEGHLVNRPGS